jgi:hypothetical protein
MNNKKGITTDFLMGALIALAILGISVLFIFILKGKGFEFVDKIKSLFRMG